MDSVWGRGYLFFLLMAEGMFRELFENNHYLHLVLLVAQKKLSQDSFIYTVLYTKQIDSKQLHSNKQKNNSVNTAKSIMSAVQQKTIVSLFASV